MSNDPNNPTTLVQVPTEAEAAIIVSALAAHQIEATTTGGFTAGFRAEAPGWVHVLVRDQDLPRAKVALAEIKSELEQIDWSQVDVGRPEE